MRLMPFQCWVHLARLGLICVLTSVIVDAAAPKGTQGGLCDLSYCNHSTLKQSGNKLCSVVGYYP